MSDLNTKDLRQIYSDNLKRANSLCKELAKMTSNPTWHQVADGLLGLRLRGVEIANAASLKKDEIETGLDRYKQVISHG